MKETIIGRYRDCINEYSNLYNSDHYISKKVFDSFLDKYKDIYLGFIDETQEHKELYNKILFICNNGYLKIEKRNENFVLKKLEQYETYFDNMFKDVDPNIILDEEQRKAIIIDEDYSLVVAGAGSGKTTTMAAKVKYLIDKKDIKPNEIILLAFTNKAAKELSDIINEKFKLNVEVLTFHKLGMKFIRRINKPVKIINDNNVYTILVECLRKYIFPNKKLLKELISIFDKKVYFDERCLSFDSFDEYYKYYMDKKYEISKNNLENEICRRVAKRIKFFKTINGEIVKSKGEVLVANYLYKNGVTYAYEYTFEKKLREDRSYSPDFTIFNLGEKIYVEYYGLATLKANNDISSPSETYKNEIMAKRKLHKENNNNYIEVFGRYENGSYFLKELSIELKKRNIFFEKRNDKDLFYRLMETSQDGHYMNFIKLITIFIHRFKEKNYQVEDFDEILKKTDDDIIKRQINYARMMYCYYQNYIKSHCFIDFQDMINDAYRNMEKVKNKSKFLNYKYVIIDEYQDISLQRYNFAKRLSDLFSSKIVAVGDDWQAIFSFSGSDVELFTSFYNLMGYAEIVKITKTYRNSQELIDLAGEFISKNEVQFQKKLISDKHLNKPVEIVEYSNDEEIRLNDDIKDYITVISNLITKIHNNNKEHKILLLGRYNKDIDILNDSSLFVVSRTGKVIYKPLPLINIEFLTIHKAKGLGYDQVIILQAIDDLHGFPSKVVDDPLVDLLNDEKQEPIEYAEERRLFYVALTRTKNKVYILTPHNYKFKSEFIKEIINHDNVLI